MLTDTLFSISFLRLAFMGALLAAVSTALMSPFITLKKISYMGEALSHISFAGMALALLLQLPLSPVTLVFVLAVAVIIGLFSRFYKMEESNLITVFLSVSMALGILLISLRKGYTIDLSSYLFGNVLLVTKADVILLAGLCIANLLFLLIFYKELFYLTYNHEMAAFFKIPVNSVYYGFLLLLACNVVITVKIIGIILITAELVLPGMIAFNLTRRLQLALILGVVVSLFASIIGFICSYWLNIPTGAVIVLILFVIFLISLLVLRTKKTGS